MDAIFIGEMLIDFTPGKEPGSYIRNAGGAPANACVAMARNELKTGFLGKLGNDDFGRFLIQTLKDNNVEILCPELTDKAVTTLAFVTLYENGERSFTFARKPGADILLTKEDIDASDIQNTRLVHAGSFGMSQSPSREATKYALKRAHEMGKLVSFDVNYRDTVWEDEDTCKKEVNSILKYVDFLKISEEELGFVGGENNIPAFMKTYGITAVIETLGHAGAKYFFNNQEGSVNGHKVTAVDATGAGDAFWGGFLSGILEDKKIHSPSDITENLIIRALVYGNAAGALCVQKPGGIPALPAKSEIEAFLVEN